MYRYLILTLVVVWGCSPQKPPQQIRVGYLPMVSSLTYFVCVENGYFIDESIDIRAVPIKTSDIIAQEIVAGHIDAGIELSVVPLLKPLQSGDQPSFKIFSISRITENDGFDGVLVKTDSGIRQLIDLSGKRVGVFPGTTAKTTFASVFTNKYPNAKLPVFEEIDPSAHLQNLASGTIDALHAYEPSLTTGRLEKDFNEIHGSIYADQQSPNPIGVGAANAKWLKGHPDQAQSLFRALDRAVEFIRTNPDESRRILAKYTRASDKVASEMNLMPMSPSTEIDHDSLNKYINTLKEMNEIRFSPHSEDICIPK